MISIGDYVLYDLSRDFSRQRSRLGIIINIDEKYTLRDLYDRKIIPNVNRNKFITVPELKEGDRVLFNMEEEVIISDLYNGQQEFIIMKDNDDMEKSALRKDLILILKKGDIVFFKGQEYRIIEEINQNEFIIKSFDNETSVLRKDLIIKPSIIVKSNVYDAKPKIKPETFHRPTSSTPINIYDTKPKVKPETFRKQKTKPPSRFKPDPESDPDQESDPEWVPSQLESELDQHPTPPKKQPVRKPAKKQPKKRPTKKKPKKRPPKKPKISVPPMPIGPPLSMMSIPTAEHKHETAEELKQKIQRFNNLTNRFRQPLVHNLDPNIINKPFYHHLNFELLNNLIDFAKTVNESPQLLQIRSIKESYKNKRRFVNELGIPILTQQECDHYEKQIALGYSNFMSTIKIENPMLRKYIETLNQLIVFIRNIITMVPDIGFTELLDHLEVSLDVSIICKLLNIFNYDVNIDDSKLPKNPINKMKTFQEELNKYIYDQKILYKYTRFIIDFIITDSYENKLTFNLQELLKHCGINIFTKIYSSSKKLFGYEKGDFLVERSGLGLVSSKDGGFHLQLIEDYEIQVVINYSRFLRELIRFVITEIQHYDDRHNFEIILKLLVPNVNSSRCRLFEFSSNVLHMYNCVILHEVDHYIQAKILGFNLFVPDEFRRLMKESRSRLREFVYVAKYMNNLDESNMIKYSFISSFNITNIDKPFSYYTLYYQMSSITLLLILIKKNSNLTLVDSFSRFSKIIDNLGHEEESIRNQSAQYFRHLSNDMFWQDQRSYTSSFIIMYLILCTKLGLTTVNYNFCFNNEHEIDERPYMNPYKLFEYFAKLIDTIIKKPLTHSVIQKNIYKYLLSSFNNSVPDDIFNYIIKHDDGVDLLKYFDGLGDIVKDLKTFKLPKKGTFYNVHKQSIIDNKHNEWEILKINLKEYYTNIIKPSGGTKENKNFINHNYQKYKKISIEIFDNYDRKLLWELENIFENMKNFVNEQKSVGAKLYETFTLSSIETYLNQYLEKKNVQFDEPLYNELKNYELKSKSNITASNISENFNTAAAAGGLVLSKSNVKYKKYSKSKFKGGTILLKSKTAIIYWILYCNDNIINFPYGKIIHLIESRKLNELKKLTEDLKINTKVTLYHPEKGFTIDNYNIIYDSRTAEPTSIKNFLMEICSLFKKFFNKIGGNKNYVKFTKKNLGYFRKKRNKKLTKKKFRKYSKKRKNLKKKYSKKNIFKKKSKKLKY